MTRVYRILRRAYAANPFDGEGTYRFGSRWSSPGTRLVYTSEHQSLAMLEYLVHLKRKQQPKDLVLACLDVPPSVSRTQLNNDRLPKDWRANPPPEPLASFGDKFAAEGRTAILIVPSALSPTEFNYLLNPAHRDFPKVRAGKTVPFDYDYRLFRQ